MMPKMYTGITVTRAMFALTILAMIATLGGCSQDSSQGQDRAQESPITVGVLLPLSGDAATWGVSMREGINLAFDELVGQRKGKVAIQLATEDDGGIATTGVSAVQKLIAVNKIRGLVGVANSSVALAILPIVDTNKFVFVSGGASSPKLSGASPFFFRTWPSDIFEAVLMARYLVNSAKHDKVAVLYINNEYGVGLEEPFSKEIARLGGEVIARETFTQGATDFRTQLVRVAHAKPQVLYLIGDPRELARCLKQAKELSIGLPVVSTSAIKDPEVIKIAGPAANGVLFTDASFDPNSTNLETQRFIKAFEDKYHQEPGMLAVTGYDALRVLVQAFDAVGTDGQQVAKYLHDMPSFPGAGGAIKFDAQGDVIRPVRISEIRDGKFLTKEQIDQ